MQTAIGKREEYLARERICPNAVSPVRGKINWILSPEYRVSLAEIARAVGPYTSAIGKAIQKIEREMSERQKFNCGHFFKASGSFFGKR
jgi:hypothetical protein